MTQKSIIRNFSPRLERFKLDRRAAIYVAVLDESGESEYERTKREAAGHKDYEDVCDVIERLENPRNLPPRNRVDMGPAPEFFRKPKLEFREEKEFIAIPGEQMGGTLRLYAAEWGMRTFLWARMIDKKGWFGSWQSKEDIRHRLMPFITIRNGLNRAIAEGRLTVNEGGPGFRRYGETEVLKVMHLTEFLYE